LARIGLDLSTYGRFFFFAGWRTLYLFIVSTGTTFHAGLYWLTFGLCARAAALLPRPRLAYFLFVLKFSVAGSLGNRLAPYLKATTTKKAAESEN
jgi:hypothetical protein